MISINPYEIILQIVNFGILFFLLKKFLAKPLSEFLHNRANLIKHNIEQSEVNKRKADDLLSEQKASLKDAQVEAQTIRKKAEDAAQKELQKVVEDGKDAANAMVEQAKKEIELQGNTARKQLLSDVSSLTVKIVDKFISNNLSEQDKKASMAKLVDEVETK
jgi:F-type H+-transporting ATPase subunit b